MGCGLAALSVVASERSAMRGPTPGVPLRFITMSALVVLSACVRAPVTAAVGSACGMQSDGSRMFRILHLNDVYRIEGLADGRGGLARVRTLRRQLESDCPAGVLLTHAGDALFPSMLSRELDGAQMIDVLNRLDGDPAASEPRMLFTPGNHEFDKSDARHAELVQARIAESQFRWLDTNITWAELDGVPQVQADNLHEHVVVDLAGVAVGVFGLTIDNKVPAYVSAIDTDYVGIARAQSAALRARGAEVVVAITHLDAGDDLEILGALGPAGPDLVLGGHDHVLQTESVGGRPMLKGDADAVRVRSVEVRVSGDGTVTVRHDKDGVRLAPDTVEPDPEVEAAVQEHWAVFEKRFCGEVPGCLDEPLSVATTELEGEETRIRRYETNLGDWVADQMRSAFPDADVAVVNSGALRLNQNVAVGTPLTRQIVEEIFAYPAAMHLVEVSGATLTEVLERSVEDWTGQGHWLQVSGVVFRHDPATGAVEDVHIDTPDGLVPLDAEATIRLVTVRYLLDGELGDQDGYTMLSLDDVVPHTADGTDLEDIVLAALQQAGDAGIAPVRAGRICNTTEVDAPCRLP